MFFFMYSQPPDLYPSFNRAFIAKKETRQHKSIGPGFTGVSFDKNNISYVLAI